MNDIDKLISDGVVADKLQIGKDAYHPIPGPTMVLTTIIDTMLRSGDAVTRGQGELAKMELERMESMVTIARAWRRSPHFSRDEQKYLAKLQYAIDVLEANI